jgi:hypothetical protein
MFTFQKKYFLLAILLLIAEIYIGLYVHDAFLRPYGGDFLIVILMYCFLKAFLNLRSVMLAISVLLFSYLVEWTQYFQLIYKLGLEDSLLAHLILGSTFHWMDMVAYTFGIGLVLAIEIASTEKAADKRAVRVPNKVNR